MRPGQDPLGQFGRKIAAAVERDPAFNAMFTNGRPIPSTWGHLASQLFELDIVDPNPEAAASFLGIAREDLSDPTIRFRRPDEVYSYEHGFRSRREREYRAERIDATGTFESYMNGFIASYKVEPDKAPA